MEKNTVFEGECISLGTSGEGVVKCDEGTVFVPFLLPGERAQIRIVKWKGNVGYGIVEEVLTPAEERVRPRCLVFYRCGGCRLQHMRYRAQLRFKTAQVVGALKKIGGISCPVAPCERSDKEYGYRNKLQLPIGRQNGKNVIGFYAERSHRIVATQECPIHPDWAAQLIAALYRFMETCGLDGYDEQTGEGQLRHIVVRELKNRYLVTLVVTKPQINGIDYLLHQLDGIFKQYSFVLNVNTQDTNVIFGQQFILLKGEGTYECTAGDITFEAGVQTFVQVNDDVRAKLYERVVSLIGEDETVIDCYAGGGLLTAMLARKCKKAYGVEIVPEASACADALKVKNGLEDKMFNLCGRVEEQLGDLLKAEPVATVVLDPPRSGVERSVLKQLIACGAKKIVMISCNPATLARDLGILTGSLIESETGELVKAETSNRAYSIELVQPFDMFPQTKHIETLICLKRK